MRYLLPLVVMFLIVGCHSQPAPKPHFHAGEMVESVIDNQPGQVTRISCPSYGKTCSYIVRFKSAPGNKWGRAYATVRMKGFEIRRVR